MACLLFVMSMLGGGGSGSCYGDGGACDGDGCVRNKVTPPSPAIKK